MSCIVKEQVSIHVSALTQLWPNSFTSMLQVLAIEFVPLINEFVTLAIEFALWQLNLSLWQENLS